jgi:hypothetical protein
VRDLVRIVVVHDLVDTVSELACRFRGVLTLMLLAVESDSGVIPRD